MGVLISYKGRKTQFWYACSRQELRNVVLQHIANWQRETVRENGQDVVREIPSSELEVRWVTNWNADGSFEAEMIDPSIWS